MNKITIVHISDIHFEKNEPENQGLIITSFFKDLDTRIVESNKDSTYCVISGDLVKKGASDRIYNEFFDNFILKLSKHIPIKNIYCAPGNHDLNRKIIEENLDNHKEILSKTYSEVEFNEFIKTKDNLILQKFAPYEKFCKEKLCLPHFNLYGYSELLIPEISIFFLNSALFSSGGYLDIKDEGVLKIETSELNKWIQENDGRMKILVLHHSIGHLTTYVQKELKTMLNNNIDILFTGHIHDQELDHNYISEQHGCIRLCSPQLFSDKTDLNGYSLLNINHNVLESVEYRQWSHRQRKFMSGQDFSGTDDGIRTFSSSKSTLSDNISQKLSIEFQKAMKSYSQSPNWVERILSTVLKNSSSKEKEEKLDYLNLINKPANYQIIAAPQFGLTCYARYLAMKAWEVKKENWLYLDCENWSLSRFVSDIDDSLNDFSINNTDVNCILLDNWRNSLKDSQKIFSKLKRLYPEIPFIILSNYQDAIIIGGLDTEESHEGFKQIYLRELDRIGLRKIVRSFNYEQQIAEENCVLERLNLDLTDLNIHRTPLNCIQLLLAFLNNFEDRPINRSKVFTYLLKLIFDNPGNLFYGSTLDEDNCSFIMGNFCEYLLRENKDSFTESDFFSISIPFSEKNYNISNISDLLQILKNNQILVDFYGALKFRFSYWIYYFAAGRMKISKSFADFMFNQKHSLYYPEIIEFYTGTDGAREDVARMIIDDLNQLSDKVHQGIGLKDDLNPFSEIKWTLNETVKGLTQGQLEENVLKSKLPDEIKDAVADKNYNSIRPYNQTINDFFEDYDIKNLMELTRSASRALRNSEFISPKLKEELAQSIFKAWKEIIRVLFLIAPVLAKNGFGGLGGARFQLSEDFPKEYSECLKNIVIEMPFNVMNWYKDDIFSDKLILLLKKYMVNYQDPIVQHIIALLICTGRPKKWQESITEYIGKIGKNSYFLGDLYVNLRLNYATNFMLPADLKQTENLIKSCWVKHQTGTRMPGKETISKVSKDNLPIRQIKDLE